MPALRTDVRLAIDENRRAVKWSRKEILGRALWEVVGSIAFSLSPRVFWSWRRAVLRLFGARIGRRVHICPGVRIAVPWLLSIGDNSAVGDRVTLYNLGPMFIGQDVTISQGAHLCGGTHDHTDLSMPLVKSKIEIGDGAWICADAFIGPDVLVGKLAVVGARAVVVRDVEAATIMVGNPARKVGSRTLARVKGAGGSS